MITNACGLSRPSSRSASVANPATAHRIFLFLNTQWRFLCRLRTKQLHASTVARNSHLLLMNSSGSRNVGSPMNPSVARPAAKPVRLRRPPAIAPAAAVVVATAVAAVAAAAEAVAASAAVVAALVAAELAASAARVRCSRRPAPAVARPRKFRSSRQATVRFIAAIASRLSALPAVATKPPLRRASARLPSVSLTSSR